MAISLTVPQRTGRVVASDLDIRVLGACRHPSPLASRLAESAIHYVGQADRVLLDDRLSKAAEHRGDPARTPAFELAGPRDRIFFDPSRLRAGIVTCGGLCPGINNVIRGLVLELSHGYGVSEIFGFRYGYGGLIGNGGHEPVRLTAAAVADIHNGGGTSLGTSRGDQDARGMVDRLDQLDIGILFVVGGDGTLRGAMKLVDEIGRRDLLIGVVGIPKTIDNDIHFIDRSFGFESAFSARTSRPPARTTASRWSS
jgi:6-phosphofructokinase 1